MASSPWPEGGQLWPLSTHQQTRIDFNCFGSSWPTHAIVQHGVRNQRAAAGDGSGVGDQDRYLHGDEWVNASIVYNLGHNLPVVNAEYSYLREPKPIDLTRQQHRWTIWGIATAGGYGSAGGFRTSPTGQPEISGDWYAAPEYGDTRRMADFFTTKGIEYWSMQSQNWLVTAGTRVYALAETGRQDVVYAAVGGSFAVAIAPGRCAARRFNPRSGEDVALGKVTGGRSRSFSMPGRSDWVVYLKSEPPGG